MEKYFENFQNPAHEKYPRPFFFIEVDASKIEEDELAAVTSLSAENLGYSGFAVNAQFMQHGYLSEDFFKKYKIILEEAKKRNLKICLYDENGCPSGSAYGLFAKEYPNDTVKRLDKLEWEICGPAHFEKRIESDGTCMAAVGMNMETKERIDLSAFVRAEGSVGFDIECELPLGRWKIMVFLCVKDGSQYVDYLSEESVKKFIELTHGKYYRHFPEYFGNVIDSAFYDEPAMMGEHPWMTGGRLVREGRMWAPGFNEAFENLFGESAALHYPALWYDIGEGTQESRFKLIHVRAELFERYIHTMADWCEEHMIQLTGHTWEEVDANPSSAMGDLMKVFRHQHIPGLDSIYTYQYVSKGIKLVTSAANNWDKPLVMSESFGGFKYKENLMEMLYKETMDQFAKGVNYLVPHAVFFTGDPGELPPDFSFRSPYSKEIPNFTRYAARLSTMLQGGRHIADIAVWYPIFDLQAEFHFAVVNDRCVPAYCNYQEIGEMLSLNLRRDFTYLHPEAFLEKCGIDEQTKEIVLRNKVNFERFKVLILPAMERIDLESLQKIKAFYDAGGKIIAVGKIPSKAIQERDTPEVKKILSALFPIHTKEPNENKKGGKTWFIETLSPEKLQECVWEAVPAPDVVFENIPVLAEGSFSYIHKNIQNRDIYFVANSSNMCIHTDMKILGRQKAEIWNPHTGERVIPSVGHTGPYACVDLHINPIESLFIVSDR